MKKHISLCFSLKMKGKARFHASSRTTPPLRGTSPRGGGEK